MNKSITLLIILIMHTSALANEQISNLITPVSYFVNHVQQMNDIKNNLNKYGKVGIVGTSGIGKTQLMRTYAYENKNNYNFIWVIDSNLDINMEFVKLAKRLNQVNKANVSEDAVLAKKEIMEYLTNKNDWLLVLDNLKIGDNKKIKDMVDWEHNGNIIFCSQEGEGLPNIVEVTNFNTKDAITLANNILENKDQNSARYLAESFKGYPILIVQGAQLLNQVKGLNKEDYKNKVYQSADKVRLNIELAIKEPITPTRSGSLLYGTAQSGLILLILTCKTG